MRILKKVYTLIVLLFNYIIRRRNYKLRFIKENNLWYYHFWAWGFNRESLQMTKGADGMCGILSDGKRFVDVRIKCSKKPLKLDEEWLEWCGMDFKEGSTWKERHMDGRYYINHSKQVILDDLYHVITEFWINHVTLFVLGRYPNYIYFKLPDNG